MVDTHLTFVCRSADPRLALNVTETVGKSDLGHSQNGSLILK